MKIECRCGRMIIDQTDCLPYKAHLIPDQEWFQVHDDRDGKPQCYVPATDETEKAILGSRDGDEDDT